MSNTAINIRIALWYWQVTFTGVSTFTKGKYACEHKLRSWLLPISIFDFRPWAIQRKKA